jgi:diacylglycerol O-acyltransferase / wax synthase
MGPLDASFLYLEDGITHLHIAACSIFEGPVPAYQQVVAAIGDKLDRIPRYRQVVRFVPLQLGRPVWVDDPHFNLDYHVRHTALPAPGGREELRHLMGRLMSLELDRRRPLWEAWVVEGLEDGMWALITKIHHCMADGVSGNDLHAAVLDREPLVHESRRGTWTPERPPSDLRLVVDALMGLALSPYEQARAARRVLRTPRRALRQLSEFARGVGSYGRRLAPTGPNPLVGSIGPHRRWTWASTDLDDLKRVRRTFGGTVNDVILTVVAAGLRDMLLGRGESVDRIKVRTLVPVSVRRGDERGTWNNRVSAMLAELPVALEDPVARLSAVTQQMEMLKASHEISAGEIMTALGELTPFVAIVAAERAVMRVLRSLPQHSVNTVTTNVPGPQYPLYLAGRQMLEYLPFVPIAPGVRVGVAIVSYNGKVAFGITGDYDSAPDIDVLGTGIERAVAELVKLTQ